MNEKNIKKCVEFCSLCLEKIKTRFLPNCKITLLMRNPEEKNGDLILTEDDFDAILKAVEDLKGKHNEGDKEAV